jgi:hypothetical protein
MILLLLILYTIGRTPWAGDQPVVRPLPTHRTTETQNKRTQYRHHALNGIGTHDPSVRANGYCDRPRAILACLNVKETQFEADVCKWRVGYWREREKCVRAHAAGCVLKGTQVCLHILKLPHDAIRIQADFMSHIRINSENGTGYLTSKVHIISLWRTGPKCTLTYWHTSFYCAFYRLNICGNPAPSKFIGAILFSNRMCSLRVSASHFGNSRNISNLLIIIIPVIVICDQ